jgi:hypothetical protein
MYLYFGTVVGLVLSNDPESDAGGSVATGMNFPAAHVKGDNSDKRDNVTLLMEFGCEV